MTREEYKKAADFWKTKERGEGDQLFWEIVSAPEDGEEPESFFITLNPDDQLESGVPFSLTIYAGVEFR